MTAELLDIEVITGERVREIIKENGGTVFEDEDLHTEAIKDEDTKEEKKTEEVKSQETKSPKEVIEEDNENKPTQN
jgi:cell division protease FtsH